MLTIWIILSVLALIAIVVVALVPFEKGYGDMEDESTVTDLIKKVRKIEVKAKRLSNQIFSGEYHSAFKGRGMSFSEVREYQFGDDVRNIDWNVTARFNQPFIKVFEEERELTVMLMIDVSQSAYFGTKGQMKNELITELSAILAISAINNNDKVGVILFSEDIEKFIPPKKGKTHILRIINELYDYEPTGKSTNIEKALQYLTNVMRRKAIVFLLSDFMDETGFQKSLDLVSRRHDMTAIHIYDPAEAEMPNIGLIRQLDPETGETRWLNTSSTAVRKQHTIAYKENYNKSREAFLKSGAGFMSIRTDRPYTKVLMDYFKRRGA